ELTFLVVGGELLHRVRRTPALIRLGAGAHVAHIDLNEGAALAGLDELDLDDRPLTAVMLDDHAGTDGVRVDLHGLDRIRVGRGLSAPRGRGTYQVVPQEAISPAGSPSLPRCQIMKPW